MLAAQPAVCSSILALYQWPLVVSYLLLRTNLFELEIEAGGALSSRRNRRQAPAGNLLLRATGTVPLQVQPEFHWQDQ